MWPCCGKFIVFMRKMVHFNGQRLLTPCHGHALVRVLSTDKEMIPGKDAICARAQSTYCYYPSWKHSRSAPSHELLEMLGVFSLCVCVCVCVCARARSRMCIAVIAPYSRHSPALCQTRSSHRGDRLMVCGLYWTRCVFLSPSQQKYRLMAGFLFVTRVGKINLDCDWPTDPLIGQGQRTNDFNIHIQC